MSPASTTDDWFRNIEQGGRTSQEGWTYQTKIKFKTKTGLAEKGGTTIGSATIGVTTTRILTLKRELRYSINELSKEESRSKDLKHRTLSQR